MITSTGRKDWQVAAQPLAQHLRGQCPASGAIRHAWHACSRGGLEEGDLEVSRDGGLNGGAVILAVTLQYSNACVL
jgi:hypothetical protein